MNSPNRTAHFLAQIAHESDAFQRNKENLSYSTPERLRAVWPSRFPTLDSAMPFIHNPKGLALHVYGNRMDLGNTEPEDGWNFIGRGLIQMTGRGMYSRIGLLLDAPFVSNPELVNTIHYALPAAAEIWRLKGCNRHADVNDLEGITRRINGGLNGLTSRKVWLDKMRTVVTDI